MILPWEQRLGAEPIGGGRYRLRCWAPRPETVTVRVNGLEHAMEDVGGGVFEVEAAAAAGDDYVFVLDGEDVVPDPSSRWQPEGLRGPSRLIDPTAFTWTDAAFETPPLEELVIYELHLGTFSADGTFDSAIAHLDDLVQLGVNAIEIMPIAEFPGTRGWGYDGVYHSAAQSSYGGPLGFQRLVDAAHAKGLAVILDVVYNHVGASGNTALTAFGPYHTERYSTFWGAAMNFDDEDSGAVREWVLQSAEGWVRDFHVDGLRLDAIHAIFDASAEHLVAAINRRVHAVNHSAIVIAESGLNDPKVMSPQGYNCDAAWADDFHHALRVLLTGDRSSYYEEFGRVADLAKAFHRPHVHDGTYSTFRKRRFGAKAEGLPPECFVVFSANHDQVGNRPFGDRLPEAVRPLAAFATLLSPFVPMLWMGDEYGEPAPFQFFTDHIDEEIAIATRDGRRREFSFVDEVPDPQDPATFQRSLLTRVKDAGLERLHRDLIVARRGLPAGDAEISFDEDARWLRVRRGDRTMIMNFATTPLPLGDAEVLLCTHAVTDALPPLAGALVRG